MTVAVEVEINDAMLEAGKEVYRAYHQPTLPEMVEYSLIGAIYRVMEYKRRESVVVPPVFPAGQGWPQ